MDPGRRTGSDQYAGGERVSALVDAARRYLGVPFKHQGRSAAALDCAGLGWLAYRDCGVMLPDVRRYGREPFRGHLMEALRAALGEPFATGPEAALQPGDVAVFRFREEPHHVALIGAAPYGGLTLIHADSSPTVRSVVEHRLDDWWRSRLLAAFRRPV
jgi:cell wall-associated NlpC family hydrolase